MTQSEQDIEARRAYHRAYYQANRDHIRKRRLSQYKPVKKITRAERREEVRQAVEMLIATRQGEANGASSVRG